MSFLAHGFVVLAGAGFFAETGSPLLSTNGEPRPGHERLLAVAVLSNADEARRVFDALSPGGKVVMPMAKTFWAEALGMLTDQFGTPWMVSGGGQG